MYKRPKRCQRIWTRAIFLVFLCVPSSNSIQKGFKNGIELKGVAAGGDHLFAKNKTAINKNIEQLLKAHLSGPEISAGKVKYMFMSHHQNIGKYIISSFSECGRVQILRDNNISKSKNKLN
jgi:hypothetical protein